MCAARPVLHLPRRVLHVPTPPPPPQHPRPVRHPAAPTVNRPGRPTASPGAWSISAISPGGIFKKTVAYQADIVISGRVSVILALIYQPKRLIRHSLIYHRYIKLIAWWCVIRTTHSHRPTPHARRRTIISLTRQQSTVHWPELALRARAGPGTHTCNSDGIPYSCVPLPFPPPQPPQPPPSPPSPPPPSAIAQYGSTILPVAVSTIAAALPRALGGSLIILTPFCRRYTENWSKGTSR